MLLTRNQVLPKRIAAVVPLLYLGGPTTIFLRIRAVWVNSIYGGVYGFISGKMVKVARVHIVSELFKRGPKTLDTSTAVVLVRLALRTITTSLNITKTSVKRVVSLGISQSGMRVIHT